MPLVIAIVVGCLAVAAWAGVRTARDQPVVLRQLFLAGGVEALLLAQGVTAGIGLAGGHQTDGFVFWGYAITAWLMLPGAALWAFAERTRWSSVVLLVAALVVAFLQWRMLQIWAVG